MDRNEAVDEEEQPISEEPSLSRRAFLTTAAGMALGAGLAGGEEQAEAAAALPRRVLGKTGVRVPILGFGTASAGIRRSLSNGAELFEEAINLGVNYMDTAPSHTGYGRAQAQLGQVLKNRRKDVFVVTKCHESGGEDALRLLKRNLKELRTDHADLVYVHSLGDIDLDKALGRDGIFPALMKAKSDGLTRFVGISGHHRPAKFLRALAEYDIDVIMCAVNFADRHTYNFEQRVFPVAAQKNTGLVAMKVFGGANWQSKAMSNRMMPPEHLRTAFRYALSLPRVSLAVVGMATREELHQNLAWARQFRPLSEKERTALQPTGRKIAQQWGAHFGPVG